MKLKHHPRHQHGSSTTLCFVLCALCRALCLVPCIMCPLPSAPCPLPCALQLPRTSYLTSFTYLVLCSYASIVLLIIESLFVFYISAVVRGPYVTVGTKLKTRRWYTTLFCCSLP